MIVEKKVKIDGDLEVPVDMVTDMKLTCRDWEKKRKMAGLNLTDKERISQLEMSLTSRTADMYFLERRLKMLEILVLIIAIGEVIKGVISIIAR